MDISKSRIDTWSVFDNKRGRALLPGTPEAFAQFRDGRYCFCLRTDRYDDYVEEFSSCRLELTFIKDDHYLKDDRYLVFSTDEVCVAFVDLALVELGNPERRKEIASNPEIFYDEIAHMLGNSFTEDRVASKIAELYVYLKLRENGIEAVFGGFEKKSLHDINCGDYVIEVKSTQKHHGWPITTNPDQMKVSVEGADLYLCLVRMEPTDAEGKDVYSIEKLDNLLGEYSGTDSLPNMPRNSSVRGKRFLVQEVRILQVTQSFPRPYLEGNGAKLTNYTLNLDPDALGAQDIGDFLKQKGKPGRVQEFDSEESAINDMGASEEDTASEITECADSDQTASSRPRTNLRIVYNDGRVIVNKTAKASLIQFIKEIGADRIAPLNIRRGESDTTPLLLVESGSDTAKSYGYTKEPVCGYHVWTYSETDQKKMQIEKIIDKLKLGAKVEIIDDTCSGNVARDADKARSEKSGETSDTGRNTAIAAEAFQHEQEDPMGTNEANVPEDDDNVALDIYGLKIGDIVSTDKGEYTIKAQIAHGGDDGNDLADEDDEADEEGDCYDDHIEVYVGRHNKGGHYDLLVMDDDGIRVVGDDNDASCNWEEWSEIETACGELDWKGISNVDADLVGRLQDRRNEARLALRITPLCSDSCGKSTTLPSTAENIGEAIAEAWMRIPWDDIESRRVFSRYPTDSVIPAKALIRRGLNEHDAEVWIFRQTSNDESDVEDWRDRYPGILYPDYFVAPRGKDDDQDKEGNSLNYDEWTYFYRDGTICDRVL